MTVADAKAILYTALKNSAALKALLGGAFVYYEFPDETVEIKKLPAWVVYYEIENRPQFADGREYYVEAVYQVDVFSWKSTTKIADTVNDILSALGFERQMSSDTVEDETPVLYRKAMQYRIMMEV